MGLQGTAQRLQNLSGATQLRLMPSLKLYKIGVRFDLGGEESTASSGKFIARERVPIDPGDRKFICVLQQHLPIKPRPFDIWAKQAELSPSELLSAARRFIELGVMRRFSAVLRHRAIGVSANAMGVWIVPPEQHDRFGEIAAENPAVSHCYLRPSYPDFPYSLFTMVHGKTRADCEVTLASISRATGIADYTSLYSSREFKKVRIRYFAGDIEQWELDHAGCGR
jgi:DNA-binding Lrp family transcriptional regulator